VVHPTQQHLDSHEAEDGGQTEAQVDKTGHGGGEKEVQRPQTHDREGDRCEDEERLAGYAEDGGDRVDSEDHVGGLNGD
jgi:hypothetical protein